MPNVRWRWQVVSSAAPDSRKAPSAWQETGTSLSYPPPSRLPSSSRSPSRKALQPRCAGCDTCNPSLGALPRERLACRGPAAPAPTTDAAAPRERPAPQTRNPRRPYVLVAKTHVGGCRPGPPSTWSSGPHYTCGALSTAQTGTGARPRLSRWPAVVATRRSWRSRRHQASLAA